jgi:hypothetical protein
MLLSLATKYWAATAAATSASPYDPPVKHLPGVKLSIEERNRKSDQHQFGLCCDCDAGLDDRADFIIGNHATYTRLLCNDCSAYYAEACTALRARRFLCKIDDMNVCDM